MKRCSGARLPSWTRWRTSSRGSRIAVGAIHASAYRPTLDYDGALELAFAELDRVIALDETEA